MTAPALEILRGLEGTKGNPNNFTCRCPGHDDQQNSLQVKLMNNGKVSVTCYAGCDINDILSPLAHVQRVQTHIDAGVDCFYCPELVTTKGIARFATQEKARRGVDAYRFPLTFQRLSVLPP